MRTALRVLAAIIGIVGAVVALIVNIVYSGVNDLLNVSGLSVHHSHGFVGLLLVVVGVIGALVAIPRPVVGALLLLVAGLGFIVIVHWWAFIASPLLLLAAVLAYMDRNKAQAKAA